jgi:glucose/arabinose dehydrogenase
MKYTPIVIAILLVIVGISSILALFFFNNYLALNKSNPLATTQSIFVGQSPTAPTDSNAAEIAYTIEEVAANLYVPWSLVFTSENRILVTERNGAIRVIENQQLKPDPLISFPEVDSTGEEGLMGMVLDPNYTNNKYLYVCLAYPKNGDLYDKVIRLVDNGSTASIDKTIIDDIPAARFHAGCELSFGPDGKLYISTGDATDKNIAQDLNSLGGKILRINSDGSIPSDNPFPLSTVWSYGHRNPQGLAWHPTTNQLFSTEHGPSVFDGPAGGDEINIITKGANYGWPVVSHQKTAPDMTPWLLEFTPAVAPASAHFYTGTTVPQFQNNLLVGLLKGEGILRVVLEAPNFTNVSQYQKIPNIEVGRIRDLTTGPDGNLYFTTSNRDGRGTIRDNDDKIYRLVADES